MSWVLFSIAWIRSDYQSTIVASGLIALVDDAIKSRFHNKRSVQLVLPIPSKTSFKDYTSPKKLIDEIFHRPSSFHRGSTF